MHRALSIVLSISSMTVAGAAKGEPPAAAPSTDDAAQTTSTTTTTTTGTAHHTSISKGLLVSGEIVGAVSYAGAGLFAFTYTIIGFPIPGLICKASSPGKCGADSAELWPWVPGVGPFASAHAYKTSDSRDIRIFKASPGLRTALYVDGALQLTGLALIVSAYAVGDWVAKKEPQENSAANRRSWLITPLSVGPTTGLGVMGRFSTIR